MITGFFYTVLTAVSTRHNHILIVLIWYTTKHSSSAKLIAMVSGPIIVIEDDDDDKDIMNEVLKELNIPNKIVWFKKCTDAVNYLKQAVEQPFVIISDVNLPGLSGTECKQRIDNDEKLRVRSIPFVFLSTAADKKTVNTVYTVMNVQGYFQKSSNYDQIKHTIKTILEYWKICKHPNSDEERVG